MYITFWHSERTYRYLRKEILEISKKFKEGHTGAMLLNLDGKDYYLVYENQIFRTGYFWDLSRQISSIPV